MKIAGQTVVVTGGGTGMGGAAAEALAVAGATVVVAGRRVDVIEAKARAIGATAIACDVSETASIDRLLDRATRELGTPRVIVHAAADGRLRPALGPDGTPTSFEMFEAIVRTDLLGTFYLAQQAAARMARLDPLEDGIRGLIINVSSIGASDGGAGGIAYCAAKGGVDAMTLSLARELSAFGIRVMTIAPGPVKTPLMDQEFPPEVQRMIVDQSIVLPKRLGDPGEFARLVMHVIDNDFLNGSIIRLDAASRVPFMRAQG